MNMQAGESLACTAAWRTGRKQRLWVCNCVPAGPRSFGSRPPRRAAFGVASDRLPPRLDQPPGHLDIGACEKDQD
jgi:hypothetical protein